MVMFCFRECFTSDFGETILVFRSVSKLGPEVIKLFSCSTKIDPAH